MPDTPSTLAVHWFRRDLRTYDNAGLDAALRSGHPVVGLFVFDRHILDLLPRQDRRVAFLHQTLARLQQAFGALGGRLWVLYGIPETLWPQLLAHYPIATVTTGQDYEPYALQRDEQLAALFREKGVAFHRFDDHVLLPPTAVRKEDGTAYQVFTPYKKAFLKVVAGLPFVPHETPFEKARLAQHLPESPLPEQAALPSLASMGFDAVDPQVPPLEVNNDVLRHYQQSREFPGQQGTSRLGVHLRFGTLSIRRLAETARTLSETYLSELIWREFYQMILHAFPHVVERAFKPAYDNIPWRDAPEEFARWQAGETGYPIVDAGMRELRETGFMHNRVRMIVASFLAKHLLLDWRLGEAHFAQWLLDYELASNNGGWQWAAGTGVDAAPYFRVFSPEAQTKKFDPSLVYVRRWVPEFESFTYPKPMVPHSFARQRALEVYRKGLGNALAG